MKISETYSHLNGLEFLLAHKPSLWEEIKTVIQMLDAEACKTKVSKEKSKSGKLLYSPVAMNAAFDDMFKHREWKEGRIAYWVTKDVHLIHKTLKLPPDEQKKEIEAAGGTPIFSYNRNDFVKDRVAIEIQFGKYAFVTFDLFVKHMAFYVGGKIDVGIEILPMKSLQSQMSSGVANYEGELYNVLRQGSGVPGVPLVLIGIEP